MTNRQKAINIINREVEAITMMSLSDLPDTASLCDYIDEIEEMIDNGYDLAAEVTDAAREFAREFVEEEFGELADYWVVRN